MSRPKPLWKADDQKGRLSELTAQSDDSAKEHALRRDVRSLGALLGRVLVEQVGQELFDTVEELRRLMIRHRERVGHSPAAEARGELMAKRTGDDFRDGSDSRLSGHQGFRNLFRTGESGGDEPSQTPTPCSTVGPATRAAAGIIPWNAIAHEGSRHFRVTPRWRLCGR